MPPVLSVELSEKSGSRQFRNSNPEGTYGNYIEGRINWPMITFGESTSHLEVDLVAVKDHGMHPNFLTCHDRRGKCQLTISLEDHRLILHREDCGDGSFKLWALNRFVGPDKERKNLDVSFALTNNGTVVILGKDGLKLMIRTPAQNPTSEKSEGKKRKKPKKSSSPSDKTEVSVENMSRTKVQSSGDLAKSSSELSELARSFRSNPTIHMVKVKVSLLDQGLHDCGIRAFSETPILNKTNNFTATIEVERITTENICVLGDAEIGIKFRHAIKGDSLKAEILDASGNKVNAELTFDIDNSKTGFIRIPPLINAAPGAYSLQIWRVLAGVDLPKVPVRIVLGRHPCCTCQQMPLTTERSTQTDSMAPPENEVNYSSAMTTSPSCSLVQTGSQDMEATLPSTAQNFIQSSAIITSDSVEVANYRRSDQIDNGLLCRNSPILTTLTVVPGNLSNVRSSLIGTFGLSCIDHCPDGYIRPNHAESIPISSETPFNNSLEKSDYTDILSQGDSGLDDLEWELIDQIIGSQDVINSFGLDSSINAAQADAAHADELPGEAHVGYQPDVGILHRSYEVEEDGSSGLNACNIDRLLNSNNRGRFNSFDGISKDRRLKAVQKDGHESEELELSTPNKQDITMFLGCRRRGHGNAKILEEPSGNEFLSKSFLKFLLLILFALSAMIPQFL